MDKGTEDLLISKNFSFFNLHLIPLHQAGADMCPFSFKKNNRQIKPNKTLATVELGCGFSYWSLR